MDNLLLMNQIKSTIVNSQCITVCMHVHTHNDHNKYFSTITLELCLGPRLS